MRSPFARSRRRWENNIRMNFKKNEKDDIAGFICPGQGRNSGTCKQGNKILGSRVNLKKMEKITQLDFSVLGRDESQALVNTVIKCWDP